MKPFEMKSFSHKRNAFVVTFAHGKKLLLRCVIWKIARMGLGYSK